MGAPDIVWLRRPAHGRPPRRRGRIGSVPTIDQIEQILGPEAQALLEHRCQTIPKESLHLPGPDFVERLHLTSDRPTRVLSSLQSLFNHGRLRGTGGGPAVLLVTHYDGHAATPAAGDDASGVGIVVEVMRALRAGPPLAHDVIALFTDAEEEGMLGARAFAASPPISRS